MTILTNKNFENGRIGAFLEAIGNGNSIRSSAALAGIGEMSVHAWKREAKIAERKQSKGKELTQRQRMCIEFQQQLDLAEAQAVNHCLQIIRSAAKKSWQAAAWYLERRHPHEWGRYDRQLVNVQRLEDDNVERLPNGLRIVEDSDWYGNADRIPNPTQETNDSTEYPTC